MLAMNQVIILFLVIIVGYFVKKRHLVQDSMKEDITNLVVNITLPAFIFTSMTASFSIEILKNSGKLIVISFSMYAFAFLLGKVFVLITKPSRSEAPIYRYIIAFSNCGFMGYPVIDALLGSQGVFYAAIFNLGFTTLVWTYGVSIIKGESNEKRSIAQSLKSIITPPFIAILAGFLTFLFQIKWPFFLTESLSLIGRVTSPLSMMLIGFILSEIHIKDILAGDRIYLVTLIRLVILPSSLFFILNAFGLEGYLIQIPVIIAAMPAAANTAIISSKYNGNYQLASKGIFITTLLSILSIPLIVTLVV